MFYKEPHKKERPKGVSKGLGFGGPKRYKHYKRERAINANRMPRHTAAGRPEANGGQVGFGGSAKSKQSQSNRFTGWLIERGSTQSLVSFEACTAFR